MSNQKKTTLKTAGAAAAGAVGGSAAAHIPKSGFWGMSRDGEESNELEPLQFETENGTVTLRDENANGVYDAAVVEPSASEEAEVATMETQSEYEVIPASEITEEPAEFSALEVAATPVSESDFDEMSFSEAFLPRPGKKWVPGACSPGTAMPITPFTKKSGRA